jgi:hypothetical protein
MLQRCSHAPIAAVRELEAPRSTSYAVRRLVIDFVNGQHSVTLGVRKAIPPEQE